MEPLNQPHPPQKHVEHSSWEEWFSPTWEDAHMVRWKAPGGYSFAWKTLIYTRQAAVFLEETRGKLIPDNHREGGGARKMANWPFLDGIAFNPYYRVLQGTGRLERSDKPGSNATVNLHFEAYILFFLSALKWVHLERAVLMSVLVNCWGGTVPIFINHWMLAAPLPTGRSVLEKACMYLCTCATTAVFSCVANGFLSYRSNFSDGPRVFQSTMKWNNYTHFGLKET